jgi:hypothetical protein
MPKGDAPKLEYELRSPIQMKNRTESLKTLVPCALSRFITRAIIRYLRLSSPRLFIYSCGALTTLQQHLLRP